MNPKIKPVVLFCVTAALWVIPSYYFWGTVAGQIFFRIFGIIPSYFLQICMFIPPIEKWVRYVPIPGIICYGVLEIILLAVWNMLTPDAILSAALFVATPLAGFAAGWVRWKLGEGRK